jgi:hypothetical protein
MTRQLAWLAAGSKAFAVTMTKKEEVHECANFGWHRLLRGTMLYPQHDKVSKDYPDLPAKVILVAFKRQSVREVRRNMLHADWPLYRRIQDNKRYFMLACLRDIYHTTLSVILLVVQTIIYPFNGKLSFSSHRAPILPTSNNGRTFS